MSVADAAQRVSDCQDDVFRSVRRMSVLVRQYPVGCPLRNVFADLLTALASHNDANQDLSRSVGAMMSSHARQATVTSIHMRVAQSPALSQLDRLASELASAVNVSDAVPRESTIAA